MLLRFSYLVFFSSLFAASRISAAPTFMFQKLQLAAQWKTLREVIELNTNIMTIGLLDN